MKFSFSKGKQSASQSSSKKSSDLKEKSQNYDRIDLLNDSNSKNEDEVIDLALSHLKNDLIRRKSDSGNSRVSGQSK